MSIQEAVPLEANQHPLYLFGPKILGQLPIWWSPNPAHRLRCYCVCEGPAAAAIVALVAAIVALVTAIVALVAAIVALVAAIVALVATIVALVAAIAIGFLHEDDVCACGTMTEEQWVDALMAEIDNLAGHIESLVQRSPDELAPGLVVTRD
ncbi:hypothetical protein EDB85DRAFT_2152378 [Lactarius pseudohatsudake]|nr:hypothetical protein EDB85DRAFT_2152378 [Lactarius pseudohatsudake]